MSKEEDGRRGGLIGGAARTAKKARAARKNGTLGGRPRHAEADISAAAIIKRRQRAKKNGKRNGH